MFTFYIHHTALTVHKSAFLDYTCLINEVSVHCAVLAAADIHAYLTDMVNGITVKVNALVTFADVFGISVVIIGIL